MDAFKLPFGFLHYLYYKAVQESRSAPDKKANENQKEEDNLRGDS